MENIKSEILPELKLHVQKQVLAVNQERDILLQAEVDRLKHLVSENLLQYRESSGNLGGINDFDRGGILGA